MDGVKFEFNEYHCIRKTILSENGQSAYMVLLRIFDDIIMNKVIYIQPIYVEPCFKFLILSYKSWKFFANLTTKYLLIKIVKSICSSRCSESLTWIIIWKCHIPIKYLNMSQNILKILWCIDNANMKIACLYSFF